MKLSNFVVAAAIAVFFILSAPASAEPPAFLTPEMAYMSDATMDELELFWCYAPYGDYTPASMSNGLDCVWDYSTPSAPYWYDNNMIRIIVNSSSVKICTTEITLGAFTGYNRTTGLAAHTVSNAYRADITTMVSAGVGVTTAVYTGVPLIVETGGTDAHGTGDAIGISMCYYHDRLDLVNNTYRMTWTVRVTTNTLQSATFYGTDAINEGNTSTGVCMPAETGNTGRTTSIGFANLTASAIYGRYYEVHTGYTVPSWAYTWENPLTDTICWQLSRNTTWLMRWGMWWDAVQPLPNTYTFTIYNATTHNIVDLFTYDMTDARPGAGKFNATHIELPGYPYGQYTWQPNTELDLGLVNPYATSTTQAQVWMIERSHRLVMDLSKFNDGKYYALVTGEYRDNVTGVSVRLTHQNAKPCYFEVTTPPATQTNTTPTNNTTPTTPTNNTPIITNATDPGFWAGLYKDLNTGIKGNPAGLAICSVAAAVILGLLTRRRW